MFLQHSLCKGQRWFPKPNEITDRISDASICHNDLWSILASHFDQEETSYSTIK